VTLGFDIKVDVRLEIGDMRPDLRSQNAGLDLRS